MTNDTEIVTSRRRKLTLLTSGGSTVATAQESERDGEWAVDWQSPMEPGLARHMFQNRQEHPAAHGGHGNHLQLNRRRSGQGTD